MAGIMFPPELQTAQTQAGSSVSAKSHNDQITTLEGRDQYILDFLSKFDALPIGSILPTSIQYTESGVNKNMPNGWIWADGRILEAKTYPKLWNLIRPTIMTLDEYEVWANNQGFTRSSPNNLDPCGYYVLIGGSKDDINSARFTVPNLRNIFLRSIGNAGSGDDTLFGKFEMDTVRPHSHNIPAYPVNGANLNSAKSDIGIALTDKITQKYTNLTGNTFVISEDEVSTNNSLGILDRAETKPRNISYRFMLKVEYTDFTIAANVETDSDSVGGYYPSTTSPVTNGNISAKIFPIPDENGLLDPKWIDTSSLTELVMTEASTRIENIVSEVAVPFSSVSYEPQASSIPISQNGKINTSYLNIATNDDILSLFS